MHHRRTRPSIDLVACLVAGLLACGAITVRADELEDRIDRLNELLKDLPTVVAEERAGEVVVLGWTRNSQDRDILKKALGLDKDALDFTNDDIAESDRMVEIDVSIVVVSDQASRSIGFDFLQLVTTQFSYFSAYHSDEAKPGLEAPGDFTTSAMTAGHISGNIFHAAVDYNVNIANATDQLVNIVARPHLATLNGQKAEFLAGGEIVFKVSGLNSGRIQPYPFGITLKVTPTILQSPGPNGETQVLLDVEAERQSLPLEVLRAGVVNENQDVIFDKTTIKSKALLPMTETLVLSGLYQREHRTRASGVPILRSIPIIKYFFSNRTTVDDVLSTVIFLTPREPGILNDSGQAELNWYIKRFSRYIEAREKGGETLEKFKEEYPDWYKPQPNRYATHFFMINNSRMYRILRGEDLRSDRIRRDLMSVESASEAARQRMGSQR